MKRVTSRDNIDFKKYLSLLKSKGVQEYGEALVCGDKFVRESLTLYPNLATALIYTDDHNPDEYRDLSIRRLVLSSELFAKIDCFKTRTPILVMKVPELPTQLEPIVISEGCSVLLPFQNPDNIGAALRSCAAFGVTKVLLSSEAAHPFSVKSLRASGPVAFGLNIVRVGPFRSLEFVDERSLFVFDASGTSIRDLSHSPLSRLLVFGSEGQGVKGFMPSGQRIAIPMRAGVESLNAAQTVAIALFHFFDPSVTQ